MSESIPSAPSQRPLSRKQRWWLRRQIVLHEFGKLRCKLYRRHREVKRFCVRCGVPVCGCGSPTCPDNSRTTWKRSDV